MKNDKQRAPAFLRRGGKIKSYVINLFRYNTRNFPMIRIPATQIYYYVNGPCARIRNIGVSTGFRADNFTVVAIKIQMTLEITLLTL